MPNDGTLATQQTPTLHLIIITGILHVTEFLAYLPSDKYLPIYGEKSSRVGPHALRPGLRPGTTREACFSVTLNVSSTRILAINEPERLRYNLSVMTP